MNFEKVVCCLGCKELLVELSGNKEGFTKEHVGGRLRGKSAEGNRKEENVELRNKMPNLKFYDFHNSFFCVAKTSIFTEVDLERHRCIMSSYTSTSWKDARLKPKKMFNAFTYQL